MPVEAPVISTALPARSGIVSFACVAAVMAEGLPCVQPRRGGRAGLTDGLTSARLRSPSPRERSQVSAVRLRGASINIHPGPKGRRVRLCLAYGRGWGGALRIDGARWAPDVR